MLSILAQLALAVGIIAAMYLTNAPSAPPILGVYRHTARFYYAKLLAILVLLRLRQRERGDPELIDRPQPLSTHPMVSKTIEYSNYGWDYVSCE